MLRFEHTFEKDPRWGDLSVDILDNPPGAKIEFSSGDEGIWLAANAQGFLYLARIFAELGTRELEEGYHFHRQDWLKGGSTPGQEVSVELLHG
jgi:hypothetical protein